jgi:hypothetical protein
MIFLTICSQGCIGVPGEAVKIKLTSEPVGEMRLRSRTMFTQYVQACFLKLSSGLRLLM